MTCTTKTRRGDSRLVEGCSFWKLNTCTGTPHTEIAEMTHRRHIRTNTRHTHTRICRKALGSFWNYKHCGKRPVNPVHGSPWPPCHCLGVSYSADGVVWDHAFNVSSFDPGNAPGLDEVGQVRADGRWKRLSSDALCSTAPVLEGDSSAWDALWRHPCLLQTMSQGHGQTRAHSACSSL